MSLSLPKFLESLPQHVLSELPVSLQGMQVNRPWRWLVQFHYGEPRLHYEVSRATNGRGLELGFHCEARDKHLNRFLLDGFRRHLFEIKDTLGEGIEAEMWDKGWTKIYEICPEKELTAVYQVKVGHRLAKIIGCLHPFFVDLRSAAAQIYR